MKILYLHGFGSRYDPEHEKIKKLETLGTVVGVDIDYCNGYERAVETATQAVYDEHVDLIVGTSMGGYLASHVGTKIGVPFVALNPAVEPAVNLEKWVGTFIDWTGQGKCLTKNICADYPPMEEEGCGLVIVESGDEVVDAHNTYSQLKEVYETHMLTAGSHRFEHMDVALPLIQTFYDGAAINYGIDN